MPRHFIPKQSGPHRIACIALYRALLSQCSRLELPSDYFRGPVNPIKHLIRRQFHRNQHDVSARLVVAALKVGYEAEELLRSAGDGDKSAFSKVLSLLRNLQSEGGADRRLPASNPPAKPPLRKPEPYPGAPKVLESRPRPLSELSGRRQVPVLAIANNIPFLRFKKPQSPFLSRVLNDKILQRQKWLTHMKRMDKDIVWAADEDEWEQLVTGRPGCPVSYEEVMEHARLDPEVSFYMAQEQALKLSEQMLEIVEKERKLYDEERVQRKIEKNEKRRERRASSGVSMDSSALPGSGEAYADFKPLSADST